MASLNAWMLIGKPASLELQYKLLTFPQYQKHSKAVPKHLGYAEVL